MVRLTRLNHAAVVLNSDLIEHIDITPDTVITLTTGQILRVLETAEEVIQRIVEYRRRIADPRRFQGFLQRNRCMAQSRRSSDRCQKRPTRKSRGGRLRRQQMA